MSIETLKNVTNNDVPINRVDVEVLKNRIIQEKRKTKFQNRVILGSVIISIGLLGYLVG